MNAFVASGLVKRRAELVGGLEKSLRPTADGFDLENFDATILKFEPNFKVEAIKPRRPVRRLSLPARGATLSRPF
jgi:hypothetical protein